MTNNYQQYAHTVASLASQIDELGKAANQAASAARVSHQELQETVEINQNILDSYINDELSNNIKEGLTALDLDEQMLERLMKLSDSELENEVDSSREASAIGLQNWKFASFKDPMGVGEAKNFQKHRKNDVKVVTAVGLAALLFPVLYIALAPMLGLISSLVIVGAIVYFYALKHPSFLFRALSSGRARTARDSALHATLTFGAVAVIPVLLLALAGQVLPGIQGFPIMAWFVYSVIATLRTLFKIKGILEENKDGKRRVAWFLGE